MNQYAFPLCIQLAMPVSLQDAAFSKTMELLSSLGFYGVELNVTDFSGTSPDELSRFLAQYQLKMTMLATGAYAKKEGLSLGSSDESIRTRSVDAMCRVLIPFAEKMGCDIICGFIKGNTDADMSQLQKSVSETTQRSGGTTVKIYLEATNHYESSVINRMDDGAAIISGPWRVLPDTYHMNIEETGIAGAIAKNQTLFQNIHVSDNNRYYPGFGAIDFYQIFLLLKSLSYKGTISIEGRNMNSREEDIIKSSNYLAQISSRMI